MFFFDVGDEVAVRIWDKSNQRFYFETGTVIDHAAMNHYLIKFNSDGKLYKCHTSKVVSIEVTEQVEIVNEKK